MLTETNNTAVSTLAPSETKIDMRLLNGQWLVEEEDEETGLKARIRVEIEVRNEEITGNAYLYFGGSSLPGFMFPLFFPKKDRLETTVSPVYLHPDGRVMTPDEREIESQRLESIGWTTPPVEMRVELTMFEEKLQVAWKAIGDDRADTVILQKSLNSGRTQVKAHVEINDWDSFRRWASGQNPREWVFRGQQQPYRLVSSFHRSWRSDIRRWVNDDVSTLYGAVVDRFKFPLQLGVLHHNAAIWSILQHHGYPTPMLDWSYSPFVAAFFAFQRIEADTESAPTIFALNVKSWAARYGRMNFIADTAPNQLVAIESMQVDNPRHLPQQAMLTVTNMADVESFVAQRELEDEEEYLIAFDLPLQQRETVLRELELMGITYGSLFPGLDGICRDMKERHFKMPSGLTGADMEPSTG